MPDRRPDLRVALCGWAQRYNGPANGDDDAIWVAVSPGGTGCW
jgi:hypothetical protein